AMGAAGWRLGGSVWVHGSDERGDGPHVRSRVSRFRVPAPLPHVTRPVRIVGPRRDLVASSRGVPKGRPLHRTRRSARPEKRRRAGRAYGRGADHPWRATGGTSRGPRGV